MSARDWRSVSHRSPCGVCKSTKRCGYTLDGRVRKCCYALDGGVGHGSDDVGDFALYFNDTVPGAVRRSFEPPAESPVADPGTRHAVYAALLAACGLSDEHRAQLLRRGLSTDDIAAADELSWRATRGSWPAELRPDPAEEPLRAARGKAIRARTDCTWRSTTKSFWRMAAKQSPP